MAYYSIYESLYDSFIENIRQIPIMTITDPWWYYAIEESQEGIKLKASLLENTQGQTPATENKKAKKQMKDS